VGRGEPKKRHGHEHWGEQQAQPGSDHRPRGRSGQPAPPISRHAAPGPTASRSTRRIVSGSRRCWN